MNESYLLLKNICGKPEVIEAIIEVRLVLGGKFFVKFFNTRQFRTFKVKKQI
jgi:hypothetical protein